MVFIIFGNCLLYNGAIRNGLASCEAEARCLHLVDRGLREMCLICMDGCDSILVISLLVGYPQPTSNDVRIET